MISSSSITIFFSIVVTVVIHLIDHIVFLRFKDKLSTKEESEYPQSVNIGINIITIIIIIVVIIFNMGNLKLRNNYVITITR